MKLTGAAILVSRGMKVLQAAPAAYPYRSAAESTMDAVLLELLHRLEAIGDEHEELFDSDVREAMDAAVFYGFILPKTGYVLPDKFAMFSDEGDRLVRQTL